MTDNPTARLLDCGWCYEEQGEEVHPHPECPIGRPVAPARYRDRRDGQIIEAVQWTGSNEPALTAFAPDRFATAAVEDRIDPEDDALVLIEESHWVAIRPGCWVLRYVDHFDVESDVGFRAGWESAPPSSAGLVAVPPTTGLRDRIAAAVIPLLLDTLPKVIARARGYEVANAVLAVLPAGSSNTAATRAAALLDFLWRLEQSAGDAAAEKFLDDNPELRRMAAETEPEPEAEPEAHPPTHTWKVESPRRDTWASWGATYDEHDWATERYEEAVHHYPARPYRLVHATTTYTVEAEHQPDIDDEEA